MRACLITERPHVVKKLLRQSDLHPFGLNPVIENGQQIGDGVVGLIGGPREAKGFLSGGFLLGLQDKVTHIFFQEAHDVTGERHEYLLTALCGGSAGESNRECNGVPTSLYLTNRSGVFYDASMPTPSLERFDIAVNTPAGRLNTVLEVPTGFVPITAIVPVARRLGEEVLKLEEHQSRQAGHSVSCRMGCAACCRMLVPLSPPEAFSLLEYVDQLPEKRRIPVEQKLQTSKAELAAHGLLDRLQAVADAETPIPDHDLEPLNRAYYALRLPCPFLENEMCSIYEARPAACRELLVTSPAELCENLVENSVEPIPVSVRIGTVLGLLWSSVTGSSPRLIPLPLALDWARRHRESANRRLAGSHLIDKMLDAMWRLLSQEFERRGQSPIR
jgi:Fe-S-cluster containining protein